MLTILCADLPHDPSSTAAAGTVKGCCGVRLLVGDVPTG